MCVAFLCRLKAFSSFLVDSDFMRRIWMMRLLIVSSRNISLLSKSENCVLLFYHVSWFFSSFVTYENIKACKCFYIHTLITGEFFFLEITLELVKQRRPHKLQIASTLSRLLSPFQSQIYITRNSNCT